MSFQVVQGDVELGKTYPLYGMITKIISETDRLIVVEINHTVEALLHIKDPATRRLIQERAFDPAIFIAKVIETNPKVCVDCTQVVFGKKSSLLAQ